MPVRFLQTHLLQVCPLNVLHEEIQSLVLATREDLIDVGQRLVINPSELYRFQVDVMPQISTRDTHLFKSKAGRNIPFASRILNQVDGVHSINCAASALTQQFLDKILIS